MRVKRVQSKPVMGWNDMNAQEALEWYDEAVDHCTDYLGLDREEQQSAWNAIQSLIDSAMPVSDEVQRAIDDLMNPLHRTRLYDTNKETVFCSVETANLAIQALRQYQEPNPCDTTSCEDAPDELYELAVYKRLGITSQRAYKLWQMEQDLINSGKDLNWELPSDFDKQKEKNTYCANIENAEPLKGTVGGTLQL